MLKLRTVSISTLTIVLVVWAIIWPLLLITETKRWTIMLAALYLLLVVVLNARRHGVKLPGLIGGFLSFYILLSLVAYILSPIPDYSGRRLTAVLAGAAGYGLVYIWLTADRSRSRLFASGLALAGGVLSLAALFIVEWPSRFLVDIQALTNWLPHLGGDFYLNNNTVA
ncbi:MAG TPA: hypothetical protein VFI27_19075, partial [candidate division Zixibacteria bacterium]|nr:hypothetical protein [candidate division Zixibacteria bacterium]